MGKFFRRLQELSVNRFAALPCCPTLIAYYWGEVTKATTDPSQIAGVCFRNHRITSSIDRVLARLPGSSVPGPVPRSMHGSLQRKSQPMETVAEQW
jgi:hypothetical protein